MVIIRKRLLLQPLLFIYKRFDKSEVEGETLRGGLFAKSPHTPQKPQKEKLEFVGAFMCTP